MDATQRLDIHFKTTGTTQKSASGNGKITSAL